MAFSFPSSPTDGQEETDDNNVTWFYTTAINAWRRKAATSSGGDPLKFPVFYDDLSAVANNIYTGSPAAWQVTQINSGSYSATYDIQTVRNWTATDDINTYGGGGIDAALNSTVDAGGSFGTEGAYTDIYRGEGFSLMWQTSSETVDLTDQDWIIGLSEAAGANNGAGGIYGYRYRYDVGFGSFVMEVYINGVIQTPSGAANPDVADDMLDSNTLDGRSGSMQYLNGVMYWYHISGEVVHQVSLGTGKTFAIDVAVAKKIEVTSIEHTYKDYNPASADHPGIAVFKAFTGGTGGAAHFMQGLVLRGKEEYETVVNTIDFSEDWVGSLGHQAYSQNWGVVPDAHAVCFLIENGDLFAYTNDGAGNDTKTAIMSLVEGTTYRLVYTVNADKTSVLFEVFNMVGTLIDSTTVTTDIPATNPPYGYYIGTMAWTDADLSNRDVDFSMLWIDFVKLSWPGAIFQRGKA